MRFSDKLLMACSSLLKRKLRTILTILGVMIGVASIVIMMALAEGLNRESMEMIEKYGGLRTVSVTEGNSSQTMDIDGGAVAVSSTDPTDSKLSDSTIDKISNIAHVESVYPVLQFQAVLISGAYHMSLYSGKAMPIDVLRDMNWGFADGEWPQKGDELQFVFGNMVLEDFLDSRDQNVYWETGKLPNVDLMNSTIFTIFDVDAYNAQQAGRSQAQNMGNAQEGGDTSANSGETSAPVIPKKYMIKTAGVLEGGLDDYNEYSWDTYCDIEALEKLYKKIFKNKVIPGQPAKKNGKPYNELFYSSLNVIVDDVENVAEVQQAIGDLGYQTSSNSEWIEQTKQQTQSIRAMLGGIGAVSLLVAAIGIANTMMMSIFERTKEIGIMKVIGCGLRDIQQMFLIEAGIIGAFGGITGLILSFVVCIIINKITGADTSVIPLWMYPSAVIFAIIVSMAAGFAPSRRAMSLSALEAIRNN